MNFNKSDIYLSLGIILGVVVGKKYIDPIIHQTLGA